MKYTNTLKHPIIGRLSLIQFISYFGTWFSQVAIFSMLVSFGADEISIAIVAAMGMLPAVLLSPFLGIFIDKIDFKKLFIFLICIEIIMTIGFTFINSLDYLWILMILVFIRSGSASMIFIAQMALFPKIVKGDMLKNTNEIHSIIWSLCYALGMGIGGVVVYYIGFDTAFLLDACFYMIALILVFGLHINVEKVDFIDGSLAMLRDGFIYLHSHKKIMYFILVHASIGFTSFDVLVTLLADFEYKEILAVPLAIGWMNAIRAISLMIGPFFVSKYINEKNLHYLLFLQGISIIIWAFLQTNFYFSLLATFFIGFFTTTLWSYTYFLLQNEVDKKYLGRVISYNEMSFMLSNTITALFIGFGAKFGLELWVITIVLGCGFIFVGFTWLRYLQIHR